MIFNSLLLGGLSGIWWALLWFALPVDLRQLPVPALAALHLLPPLAGFAGWRFWQRHRAAAQAAAAQAALDAQAAEQAAKIDAARSAHEAELKQRRAYVECRGAWISSTSAVPAWFQGDPAHCAVLQDDAANAAGVGRETALGPSLRETLTFALGQSAALAWLPLYLLPSRDLDGTAQLELARSAWQAAIAATGLAHAPAQPDCKFLPGADTVADRVIALFNNDPTLPALLLAAPDSPLADRMPDDEDDGTQQPDRLAGAPGHAVVVLLFTRPGLATRDTAVPQDDIERDPYQPYWEQDQDSEAALVGWGRVPPPLHGSLLALPALARLHQARTLYRSGGLGRGNALARQIQGLLEGALINAELRDLPFDQNDAKAAEPLEIGWLAHNSGGIDTGGSRLAALAAALQYFGCEINPVGEASNTVVEYGDVGAARGPLLLAMALLRAAQLSLPTVAAEFEGDDFVGVGIIRPALAGEAA
ncbi:hypothetical protein N8I74_14705 [Chitiniphilus purpureus]|uniref:DUF2875 domain-containing protein n=1 Tax=Chitiniphilus purpureus TaxID=2981137 RepID=A0ABY6DJM0_9NEIS|nr:hypothetical protein [Chitiniphilus sp. CD1]UXY14560.1 hypothetical protein N8I74_14705 [Chitiniphilus sp. CD1]